MGPGENPVADYPPDTMTLPKRGLTEGAHANGRLARRGERALQQRWLIEMVCANRALARRAQRYIVGKNPADYAAYLQVLKRIRQAKIYSQRTNATNLRAAFYTACVAAEALD